MDIDTIRKLENTATDVEVELNKRAFSDGILLMTYASLRFADVQRLRSFETNEEFAQFTPLTSKAKKQHVEHWPWARPMMGISRCANWIQPFLAFRKACARVNGRPTPYTLPRIGYKWGLVSDGPSPYRTTRRKLSIRFVGLGDAKGESYTSHSPKNRFPDAANQMSFDQRELTAIGHWPGTSRMPERYDRSVRANELHLRNTIVRKMDAGLGTRPGLPHAIHRDRPCQTWQGA